MRKKNKLIKKIRVPTAKPTVWHPDKTKYNRKKKHKKDWRKNGNS